MSGNIINLMLSSALGARFYEGVVASRAGGEHVIEQHDTTKYLLLLGVDRPGVRGVLYDREREIHSRTELVDRQSTEAVRAGALVVAVRGSCLTGIKSVYFLLLLE